MALIRGKLAALALLGVFAAGAIVCTSVYSGSCKSAGCEIECKKHNRFCSSTRQTRFESDIALEICCESPDGGKPIEFDEVKYTDYTYCTKDCPDDDKSTGSPHGSSVGSGSSSEKTECSPS